MKFNIVLKFEADIFILSNLIKAKTSKKIRKKAGDPHISPHTAQTIKDMRSPYR